MLSKEQIEKLNTKRLLSYYKKVRKWFYSKQEYIHCLIEYSNRDITEIEKKEYEYLKNYKEYLKEELNKREHINKKENKK